MRRTSLILGLMCGAVVATFAQAEARFDGIYRPAGPGMGNWNCVDIGMDGGALAIRDDQLFGVENTCDMTAPTNVRDMDAVLFDFECQGEGMTSTDRVMLMRGDAGSIYVIRDGFVSKWDLCRP